MTPPKVPTQAEEEKKFIIEEYFNSLGNIKVITCFERLSDGYKGKRLWEKVWKDGEIRSYEKWEMLSWDEFCKRYKDCPKYSSTPS